MKKELSFLLICVYFSSGCGTLGGFEPIYFDCNKNQVSEEIDSFYLKHSEYRIPNKWKNFDDWDKRGYDFLDGRIFYFLKPPEEMYYVTFVGDSAFQSSNSPINMSIRGISKGHPKWLLNEDLTEVEIKRINERFRVEILSKINCFHH